MKNTAVALIAAALIPGLQAQDETAPTARERISDNAKWKALQRGEPVILVGVDSKPKRKERNDPKYYPTGAILIHAPVEKVWNLVNDKEAAPSYVKSLIRCRIVGEGKSHMMVEQEMKMNGLPGTFTYIVKHVMNPMKRVDFHRVSGDLRDIRGSWEFVPVEEGRKTLLIYTLHVDPGRLVPQAFVRKAMTKNLPKGLLGIKEQVEGM